MIQIALTGLNGYGEHFLPELLQHKEEYKLAAVVSRDAKKSTYYEQLLEKKVGIYTTLEEALDENAIDLVIITSPMHIHYRQIMTALAKGANVYCEKPLAPTIDECLAIKEAAKKAGRFVAVGFQWSFSKGILGLKQDIINGKYGKIKRIKTLVNWNRPKSYFENSAWKGKMVLSDGSYVLESVMSNGASHFLHNLFFLCGESLQTSGYPASMEGEGYHAYPVEGFDTAMLRMKTAKGEELLYYATILAKESETARFEIAFENGTAIYPYGEEQQIKVTKADGEDVYYECPEHDRFVHFKQAVTAINEGTYPVCDVETVLPEVIAVNAAAEHIPVKNFPASMIREDKTNIYAQHIDEILKNCYDTACLPEEAGYSFAKITKTPCLLDYNHFPGIYVG